MLEVDIEEASWNLAELIARAESGEEEVIAQSGKPRIVLIPINPEMQEILSGKEEENNSVMEEMLSAYEEEIE